MAGTSMPFDSSLFISFDFDAMQHFATFQIPDLEAEQVVHVHKTKRLICIDCEWPDHVAERTDLPNNLMLVCIAHSEDWRFQAGEISEFSILPDDSVVRS